jgi:hypothetical protein
MKLLNTKFYSDFLHLVRLNSKYFLHLVRLNSKYFLHLVRLNSKYFQANFIKKLTTKIINKRRETEIRKEGR